MTVNILIDQLKNRLIKEYDGAGMEPLIELAEWINALRENYKDDVLEVSKIKELNHIIDEMKDEC